MHKGLVFTAFLGLLVSGYLLIHYVSPEPIPCVTGEGCAIAQQSAYSSFLHIPTPVYGIVFYLTVGFLGALYSETTKKQTLPLLVLVTTIGLAVSLFLSFVEAFVIHAWCSWCVASAILSIVAFIITIRLVLMHKPYGNLI